MYSANTDLEIATAGFGRSAGAAGRGGAAAATVPDDPFSAR